MNRDKREPEYPAELESQFILRLPEEPAKLLREVLQTGENLKNRLTIQVENDMRHGEVRFDHWLMHSKIVDLPTIIESLKTIDNKSFYKTADICQMMICKNEPDQPAAEEETPTKTKKKDPYKVDKKFLWPHGITPPTKNVRKRRFRKTLKKKCVEAPEIEKEVKRLLRADNEAVSISWEVVQEEDNHPIPLKPEQRSSTNTKAEKKPKAQRTNSKWQPPTDPTNTSESSNLVDIFGGAVSDSDEDVNINVNMHDIHFSGYDTRLSDTNSMQGMTSEKNKGSMLPIEFESQMFRSQGQTSQSSKFSKPSFTLSRAPQSGDISSEDDSDYKSRDMSKENMTFRIESLKAEIEELKQRRQRTQHEIAGMENVALKQRFQDILHTLNQDIMYKDMEYQGLLVLQNSEDI